MRFEVFTSSIGGVHSIKRQPIEDARGSLSRLFCNADFVQMGIPMSIAQINHTVTRKKGAVRGMHFQMPPSTEAKFVQCLRGMIFDVALDVRENSPTYLQSYGEILSDSNHLALFIPPGCAHGFQALTNNCELLYFHSAPYSPALEKGIHPMDPAIDIHWPLSIEELSIRDANHPQIDHHFRGVNL